MSDTLAEVTDWVFAGMADPREFLPAELAKMSPTGSELHAPGTATSDKSHKKEMQLAAAGLGATTVASAGGLHAVSATLKENRGRVAAARKTRKAGKLARLTHISPVRAAELAGAGWLGLHGVELAGDALAARAQIRAINREKQPAAPAARPPARTKIAARAPGQLRRVEPVGKLFRQLSDVGEFARHQRRSAHMAAQRADVGKPLPPMPGESEAERVLRQRKVMGQANRAKKLADTRETVEAVAAHPQVQQGASALVQGFKQANAAPARKSLIRHPAALAGGGALAGAGGLSYSQRRRQPIRARAPQPVVDELVYTGQISKLDPDKRLAFGWASISKVNGEPYVDRQGDWIPIEVTEQAAYDYVRKSRVGGDMHRRAGITKDFGPHKVADLVESFVVTAEKLSKMGVPPDAVPEGWWIGMKVHDDETWDAIKSGRRTGFSVHGSGLRKEVSL